MATQQDLQELLRLLTVTRKLPMLQAMSQVKSLQAAGLRSIQQIAEVPLKTVETAVTDAKQARSLHSACKAILKRGDLGKRAAPDSDAVAASKRAKLGDGGGGAGVGSSSSSDGALFGVPSQMMPRELEASLALPLETDEELIGPAVLQTNRAPLVLAFAVELLRYTMPEQPPSSRLSLAQAVVAANSRSKAVSIGLENTPAAEREGWGEGQPKLRVLGREISVLKRGGYQWEGDEVIDESGNAKEDTQTSDATIAAGQEASDLAPAQETQGGTQESRTQPATSQLPRPLTWFTSQSIHLKSSTFVARATRMTDPSERKKFVSSLMERYPNLKTATHNAWAYRVRLPGSGRIVEESFEDGEVHCGDVMLQVMRESDAVDTLVVLSRWFGGIFLGPDRFRLMRNCVRGALAERMRVAGTEVDLGGEAVWGLDLEAMRSKATAPGAPGGYKRHETTVVGMQIHRPEAARNYLLKSFATAEPPQSDGRTSGGAAAASEDAGNQDSKRTAASPTKKKRMTQKAVDAEKEHNLGLLLGALKLLFDSWADHLTPADLDRRAWGWYTAVRPEVDAGPSGWGAKGALKLQRILDLRRKG